MQFIYFFYSLAMAFGAGMSVFYYNKMTKEQIEKESLVRKKVREFYNGHPYLFYLGTIFLITYKTLIRKGEVSKIVYDQNISQFRIHMRRGSSPFFIDKLIKPDDILFTDSAKLNNLGINYINLQDESTFGAQNVNGWKEFSLWCYLIKQNVSKSGVKRSNIYDI